MSGQEWTALVAVAIASIYLVRRGIASLRGRRGACGDCGSCSSPPETGRLPARKQLYSLGPSKTKET